MSASVSPSMAASSPLDRVMNRRRALLESAARQGKARREAYEAARQGTPVTLLRAKPQRTPRTPRIAARREEPSGSTTGLSFSSTSDVSMRELEDVQMATALSLSESDLQSTQTAFSVVSRAVSTETTPSAARRQATAAHQETQTVDLEPESAPTSPTSILVSTETRRRSNATIQRRAGRMTTWADLAGPVDLSYESLMQLEDVPVPLDAWTLNRLPRGPYVAPATPPPKLRCWEDDGEACAICLETFAPGDDVTKLPTCTHQFHWTCVSVWFAKKKTCCVCKQEVLVVQSTGSP